LNEKTQASYLITYEYIDFWDRKLFFHDADDGQRGPVGIGGRHVSSVACSLVGIGGFSAELGSQRCSFFDSN